MSGPFEVPVKGSLGAYEADASGNVLFGFDDIGTEARLLEDGSCDDGTYFFEEMPRFSDPTGPNGLRLVLGGVELALECVMGELGRGDFGIDSCGPETSPTPPSRLIRFPIQAP